MEKTERKRLILLSAAKVFAARGYHQTSVADIIEDAGIARGTFYLYFESKRAVFGELIGNLTVEVLNSIRTMDISLGSPPPYDQLHGNISRFLATMMEQRDAATIVLNHAVGLDRESDLVLHDFWNRLSGFLERALVTGCRIGLVQVRDTGIAARLILGGIKEIVHYLVVQNGEPRNHDRLVKEIIRVSICGVIEGQLHELQRPLDIPGETVAENT